MNARPARVVALQHAHQQAIRAGALQNFSHRDRRRLVAAGAVVLAGAAFAVPLVFGASASAEPTTTTTAAPTTTTLEVDATSMPAILSTTTSVPAPPATTTTIVAAPAFHPTVKIGTAVSFQSDTQTLDVGVQVISGAAPSTGTVATAAELPHTGGSPLPLTLVAIAMLLMGALAMRCRPGSSAGRNAGNELDD